MARQQKVFARAAEAQVAADSRSISTRSPDRVEGRPEADAPQIDGACNLSTAVRLRVGEIVHPRR